MNDLAFISVGYSDREDALADFRSHEQQECQDVGDTYGYIVLYNTTVWKPKNNDY